MYTDTVTYKEQLCLLVGLDCGHAGIIWNFRANEQLCPSYPCLLRLSKASPSRQFDELSGNAIVNLENVFLSV